MIDINALKTKLQNCDKKELDKIRATYKKLLGEAMAQIRHLDGDEKLQYARTMNDIKDAVFAMISTKEDELDDVAMKEKLISEKIDISLPARKTALGRIHPLSLVIEELANIMHSMGFTEVCGPDIDSEHYNFDLLNIPSVHPARSMHDTFYLHDGSLLRTHTTTSETRYLEAMSTNVPAKIMCLGRVYRADSDATHSPMFHQIDALYIDHDISICHLKWCLEEFFRRFLGVDDIPMRFRPSFFPFTEPSIEVDVGCRFRDGKLEIGRFGTWIEIAGSGMLHSSIINNLGNNSTLQGFAFGAGVERLAMLKYGIDDLRNFFHGDLRWLNKFGALVL